MKTANLWLAIAMALSCTGAALAADTAAKTEKAEKTTVVRGFTDIVAPADQAAYEAGVKSFNQCLSQHGFKYTWTAWSHETGDTYAYSYTSDPVPWSAFDAMETAIKACDQSLRTDVNPHLKSETSFFIKTHPELSHMAKGVSVNSPHIELIYFKLKPGHEAHQTFVDVAKKISEAADKSKWPNNYVIGELMDAGEGSPDFIIVLPSKTWADLGKDPETPVWTMVENVYGKQEAQAMRKSLNDATQFTFAHIDSMNTDLTYKGTGK